jgi:hypothetical protein
MLRMPADYPEAYEGQPGLEFIEKAPTVWDETKVLAGRHTYAGPTISARMGEKRLRPDRPS